MVGLTLGHYEIIEPLGAGGMGGAKKHRVTETGRGINSGVRSVLTSFWEVIDAPLP
jgi:hypothetical protein